MKDNFIKIKNEIINNFFLTDLKLQENIIEKIKNDFSLNYLDNSINLTTSTKYFPDPLTVSFIQYYFNGIFKFIIKDKRLITDLIIVIDESISNIIEHSYKASKDVLIIFDFLISYEKIILKIKDFGPHGYKLKIHKEGNYKTAKKLAKKAIKTKRGMGIFIIKKIINQIIYETYPDKSNLLTLIKNIKKSSLAEF